MKLNAKGITQGPRKYDAVVLSLETRNITITVIALAFQVLFIQKLESEHYFFVVIAIT